MDNTLLAHLILIVFYLLNSGMKSGSSHPEHKASAITFNTVCLFNIRRTVVTVYLKKTHTHNSDGCVLFVLSFQ